MSNLQERLEALLAEMGFPTDFELLPSRTAGGNNRNHVIKHRDACLFIKEYVSHSLDSRDRQGNEFFFLSFLWKHGIRAIPEPIYSSKILSLAAYGYIPGDPFAGTVTQSQVEEAAYFFSDINHFKCSEEASRIPDGSDSVYSVNAQCQRVEERILRLLQIPDEDPLAKKSVQFAKEQLQPFFHRLREVISNRCIDSQIDFTADLSIKERCLSPSDFGFHNALVGTDGKLYFVDFEYAGWDDPARTMGDFFSQPRIPVSIEFWKTFYHKAFSYLSDSSFHLKRSEILFPLHQLKWICIMLNPFLPEGEHRLAFAQKDEWENLKVKRFENAQRAYNSLSHKFP